MATKAYSAKLLDPRWQQMRLRVFERDGFQCLCCGSKTKTLNAHHSHYHPHAEGPWDYDMETIFTLCADCHSDEHANSGASKASVLLALAKMGFWREYDMDCLLDILADLTKDDLVNLFMEKSNGKNKNG